MLLRRAMMRAAVAVSKYVPFADPKVLEVLIANGVSSDGVGITTADVEKVTSIGTWFKGNTEITSFDEFEKFIGVTTVSVPSDTSAQAPFYNCIGLLSILLPKTLNIIGGHTFAGCTNLQNINLEDVEIVYNHAFDGCASLAIDVNMPKLKVLGNSVSAGSFRNSGIKSVSNLGSITTLYGYATFGIFTNCTNLEKVVLPNTLTSIQGSVFYGCTSLTSVENLHQNITELGTYAFCSVPANLDVVLPNVTSLTTGTFKSSGITRVRLEGLSTMSGNWGGAGTQGNFAGCQNLTTVILGESVTSLGGAEFTNCPALSYFVCQAVTPPTNGGIFQDLNAAPVIYVPEISVEDYKTATNWATYATKINGYTELDTLPSSAANGACYKVGDDFYVYQTNEFVKL